MARYIDAEQAKTELKHWCMETAINNVGSVIGYPEDIYADVARNRIDIWIDNVPTADVREVRHGKWLLTGAYPHWLYCDKCYKRIVPNAEWVETYNIPTNYCPYCGARMDGKGQNDGKQ